jgi:hypothetical protein
MREYVLDFVTGTIVAAILTLISYAVGFDKTWDEAAQTYGVCFVIYIALTLFGKLKNKNK